MSAYSDAKAKLGLGGGAPPAPAEIVEEVPLSPYEAAKQKMSAGRTQTFDKPVWSPEAPISYEEEGALPLALAGFGKGGANVYKNVANMLGADSAPTIFAGKGEGFFGSLGLGMTDTTDQGLRDTDEEYKGITDTTAGAVGEVGGEIASLVVPGAAATRAMSTIKAVSKLPTAIRILTGGVAEGATGGAVLAGPDNRGTGALVGGGTGGLLTGVGAAGSRLIKSGLARMKKPAQEGIEYIEDLTGKRPSLPLSVAGDKGAGGISAKATGVSDVTTQMPSAKGAMESQMEDLGTDFFEADLRSALSYNKGVADKAVKILRETGDMQKALESSVNKSGRYPSNKAYILDSAARNAPEGRYTGKQLLKAAKEGAGEGKFTDAPFIDAANNRMKVLPQGDKTSTGAATLFARDEVRFWAHLLGAPLDKFPLVGSALGSKGFQNFLLGNTAAQRSLRDVMKKGSAKAVRRVIKEIRRTMASQAGGSTKETQEGAEQMIQSLRGN